MMKDILEKILLAETKQHFAGALVASYPPDELLIDAITILEKQEKRYWDTAVAVIEALGYPRNKKAIPTLIELMGDLNCPEAIEVLEKMDRSIVIQSLIKTILGHQNKDSFWGSVIEGIALSLARKDIDRELTAGCTPALAALLSVPSVYEVVDASCIFDVFEKMGSECSSYAMPALVQAFRIIEDEKIQEQIRQLIDALDKNIVGFYTLVM